MSEKSLEQTLFENRQARYAGEQEQDLPLPAAWEGSVEDLLKALREGVRELFAAEYVHIEETYSDRLYVGVEDKKGKLEYYGIGFEVTSKGIKFGSPVKMQRKTSWLKAEQRQTRTIAEEKERQRRLAGIYEPAYRVLPLTEGVRGNRLELVETLFGDFGILESKQEGGLTVVTGKAGRVDVPTANGRLYGRSVVEKEVGRLKPLLAQGKVLGQLDHPLSTEKGATRLGEVALKYTELGIDKDGYITFQGQIVETAKGKTLKALLDAKVGVGMSTRSWASTRKEKRNGQEVEVVLDDFELAAIDAVSDAAASGTGIDSYG